MENEQPPLLSLVILCYRSERHINGIVQNTIDILDKANIRHELILVGNYIKGSNDRTPQIVQEIAEHHPSIKYVAKPKEGWMGWDARCGLDLAIGDYIGITDGDGQFPIWDVVPVYQKLVEEDLDIVKTFRITRGDSIRRKVISFCYNTVFNLLFPGLNSRDINSKPKIFTRNAYDKMDLKSNDWFLDAEIMIQVNRYKLKLGEVPTKFIGLSGRRSFIRLNAIFEFIKNLIVYRIHEFNYHQPKESHDDLRDRSLREYRKETAASTAEKKVDVEDSVSPEHTSSVRE